MADETWAPTLQLRFVRREVDGGHRHHMVLQQKWVSDASLDFEWRDVPVEDEVSSSFVPEIPEQGVSGAEGRRDVLVGVPMDATSIACFDDSRECQVERL